jgi:hypothetical protein
LHIIRVISLLLLRQNSPSLILVMQLIQISNLFSISIFLDFLLMLPCAHNMDIADQYSITFLGSSHYQYFRLHVCTVDDHMHITLDIYFLDFFI